MSVGHDPYAVALDLLACLLTGLGERAPSRHFVAVGEVPLELCCDDGMAFVALESLYPTGPFPALDTAPESCARSWAALYNVGLARCVNEPGNEVIPPETYTSEAAEAMADAQAMIAALTCCAEALRGPPDYLSVVVGALVPLGPEGGCFLWTAPVTVELGGCSCGDTQPT